MSCENSFETSDGCDINITHLYETGTTVDNPAQAEAVFVAYLDLGKETSAFFEDIEFVGIGSVVTFRSVRYWPAWVRIPWKAMTLVLRDRYYVSEHGAVVTIMGCP
jgi:hypothetical protein